jgi:phosphoribosylanthranilate isomerase
MSSPFADDAAPARTWIKFCGCRDWADVSAAVEAGADAVGMIFAPSPRRINWDDAREIARNLPPEVEPVAVFVDPSPADVDLVRVIFPRLTLQFSGNESADFVRRYGSRAIKTIHVDLLDDPGEIARACELYANGVILFDRKFGRLAGGSGKTFHWETVLPVAERRPIIVAGGLSPENVSRCIQVVRPFGVDVRSGVETGERKDAEKMRAFVRAVRREDEACLRA